MAAAVATGPLVAGLSIFQGDPAETARLEALTDSARNLAAVVDAEIERNAELLAALAASPVLDQPTANLRSLDAHARATAGVLGSPVAVADTSLAQLVNTAVEFGTPLPGLASTSAALRAMETGAVSVEEQIAGQGDGTSAAVIAVPVRRGAASIAVVATEINAARLRRVLGGLVREGLSAALVDRGGNVVASTQLPDPDLPLALKPDQLRSRQAGRGRARLANGTSFTYAVRQLRTLPEWTLVAVSPARSTPVWTAAGTTLAGAGLAALIAALMLRSTLRRWPQERSAEELIALRKARAAAESEAEALRALSELKTLHDTIPVGLALLSRDFRFLSVNAKLVTISGISGAEHIGRRPSDVFPPSIAEPLEEAHQRVLATGRPVIEVSLSGEAPGTVRNTRHFLASCYPVHDGDGRITSVSIVLQDVTERVRAERGRELLVRELNHRVKNTLATVQSIAGVTLRRPGASPQQLTADLGARLRALARAHDLLTAHAWGATDLGEIAQAALAPWMDGMPARLTITGSPGVLLRPAQAQAIVLALHELATNATKHGALSREEGRANLRWHRHSDGQTTMEWIETGGPAVVEPPSEKRGFGTRLLERALASDLGAGTEVRLVFASEGLRARISFRSASTVPDPVAA